MKLADVFQNLYKPFLGLKNYSKLFSGLKTEMKRKKVFILEDM